MGLLEHGNNVTLHHISTDRWLPAADSAGRVVGRVGAAQRGLDRVEECVLYYIDSSHSFLVITQTRIYFVHSIIKYLSMVSFSDLHDSASHPRSGGRHNSSSW